MVYLEANQDKLVGEARSAASAASTAVAGAVISDVVTRLTRLEMHTEEIGKRLRRSRPEPFAGLPPGNSGEHRRPGPPGTDDESYWAAPRSRSRIRAVRAFAKSCGCAGSSFGASSSNNKIAIMI